MASQFLILKYVRLGADDLVFQLVSSAATWTLVCSTGATQRSVGTSPFSSAARSSQVSDIREPAPPAAPDARLEPLVMMRRFVPIARNTSATASRAPWPLAIIAITVPMPNTMPSIVSNERTLLRHSARSASLSVVKMFMRAARQRGLLRLVVDDQAVAQHDDAPRVRGDVVLVGDEDDRDALRDQPLEDRHHLVRGLGVEVAGRLVGHDDRRVADERARDRDALLLAARQLVRVVVRAVVEADAVERLHRALVALAATARPDTSAASRRSRARSCATAD